MKRRPWNLTALMLAVLLTAAPVNALSQTVDNPAAERDSRAGMPASEKVFQIHGACGHIRAITLANHSTREYNNLYGNELSLTAAIKQVRYEPHFILYTERVDFYEPDEDKSNAIPVDADNGTYWEARTSASWIYILEDSYDSLKNHSFEKSGSGEFYIGVDKNNSLDDREGIVTVSAPGTKHYEIQVTQPAGSPSIPPCPLDNMKIRLTRKTFDKNLTSQIKFEFTGDLYPGDIQKVVFASSNKRAAAVNKNGKISPKQKGTAMIYARIYFNDGYSRQFKVKVTVGKRKATAIPVTS